MIASAEPRRWSILGVVCLSLLVITVDTTIVNTALPTLAHDLGAGLSGLQWVVDGYTLAFAGLLLPAGALGDRFGRARALLFGLGVFAAASAVAPLASTTGQLVAARAVMGCGAAFVMPATLGLVLSAFAPGRERAKAIGAWSAVSGAGVALGPTTSGWLLEHFAWGSIFLINLPAIAAAVVWGRRVLPRDRPVVRGRFDAGGGLLGAGALTLLTWALIEAPAHGWLSATTLGAGALALALVGGFVACERAHPHALIDVRILRDRRFTAAAATISLVFLALFGMLFVLTQMLQFVLGLSTLEAGLAALPFAAALGSASPAGMLLGRRLGPRLVVAVGLISMAAGLVLLSFVGVDSGYSAYLVAMLPVGFGMGLATDTVAGALSPEQAATGAAVNNATREIGGVLGVAIVGSLTASLYTTAIAPALEHVGAEQKLVAEGSVDGAATVAQALGGTAGAELLDAARAAFMHAAGGGVLAAAGAALVGAAVAWRCLPGAGDLAEDEAASPASGRALRGGGDERDEVAEGHERHDAARVQFAEPVGIDGDQDAPELGEPGCADETGAVLELLVAEGATQERA
jgi:DHA2 family multidrug resistance protein-like MFS transporter